MNKDQVKNNANEAKDKGKQVAGKVTDDKSSESRDKAKQQGDKSGAVLGEVNDGPKKKSK